MTQNIKLWLRCDGSMMVLYIYIYYVFYIYVYIYIYIICIIYIYTYIIYIYDGLPLALQKTFELHLLKNQCEKTLHALEKSSFCYSVLLQCKNLHVCWKSTHVGYCWIMFMLITVVQKRSLNSPRRAHQDSRSRGIGLQDPQQLWNQFRFSGLDEVSKSPKSS